VGVFGTEVDFVAANDGAAALVAQVELGRLEVGFFGTPPRMTVLPVA